MDGRSGWPDVLAGARPGRYGFQLSSLLDDADRERQARGDAELSPVHLLLALSQSPHGEGGELLRRAGVTHGQIAATLPAPSAGEAERQAPWPRVARNEGTGHLTDAFPFTVDLTAQAERGELDPVIGRHVLVERVIEVLACRTKNHALLVGEPGVGKTAIVEGLALRMAAGEVPRFLRGRRILALDLGALVAGTRHRGDLEERMQALVLRLETAAGELLLFVDELHLVAAPPGQGAMGEGASAIGGLLKPALARGRLACIGATTWVEYRRRLEPDGALARRFQPIVVEEPDPAACVAMLAGRRPRDELHHGVSISDEALDAAVALSVRALPERRLPDKAIDVLDRAAARVRIAAERNSRAEGVSAPVSERDVAEAVRAWTGLVCGRRAGSDEDEQFQKLASTLGAEVLGQEDAVALVVATLRRARAGLRDPARPRASFLFVGPPGVGKTRLAAALARALDACGGTTPLIRIDLGEYLERHATARLVGAPPGYLGHDEGGQLTEAVRRHPGAVVLLDEIDKAHPDVTLVLQALLDEGRLTDGQGRTVDFRQTVLVLTMNRDGPASRSTLADRFHRAFLDRLDEVICFSPLAPEVLAAIARQLFARLKTFADRAGIALSLDEDALAKRVLLEVEAGDGARPLARAVERLLSQPLADAIVAGDIAPGDRVDVGASLGRVTWRKK